MVWTHWLWTHLVWPNFWVDLVCMHVAAKQTQKSGFFFGKQSVLDFLTTLFRQKARLYLRGERGGEEMMGGCGAENNFVLSSGSKSSKVILYTKMWEFFLFFSDRQKRYFKFCYPSHVFTVLIVSTSRDGQKKATPSRRRNFCEDFWRKDNAHHDWTFFMSAWIFALPKVGPLAQTKATATT